MLLGIIRGLEILCDVIDYGPAEAMRINSSICPQAERDYRRIMRNIETPSAISSSRFFSGEELDINDSSIAEQISGNIADDTEKGTENIASGKKCETYLEESEEEMINKAVAEKGGW